jgi:signal transduction histidine kinase
MNQIYFDIAKATTVKAEITETEILYLDVQITPLGMSVGNFLTGYMKQIQDITVLKHAETNIHDLSQQLIKAHECERQMISRELHDRVGQDLATLKIGLDSMKNEYGDHNPEIGKKIEAFSHLTQQAVTVVRELAYELRPPGLDQFGLVQTVIQYCDEFSKKTGLDIDISITGIDKLTLDFDAEINLYRLIQEGLNNIHNHAQAKRVIIKMVASSPNIILRLEDDGIGFDPKQRLANATKEKRMGLRSMQERATLLGGKMLIQSNPGKGTKILVETPCIGR